ncbi:MAG: hypothetical protein H0T84_11005, partial [Tatlockia sp.]|nr:hypothetical protein [Tatlockia sp.]
MKYKEELNQLILDKEKLGSILNKASDILDVLNQSDDLELIKEELTKPEHYSCLRQAADISDYFVEVGDSVVIDFIDNASSQLDLSEKLSSLDIKFIAIRLMGHLYHNNKELYDFFSQKKSNKVSSTFDVVYDPHFDKVETIKYQFLFDSQNNSWQVQRFSPELPKGEIITDWYALKTIEIVLANIRPETLNPFLKNALHFSLQTLEDSYQRQQQDNQIEQSHTNQGIELIPLIKKFCDEEFPSKDLMDKIDILHRSFFNNAQSKPELMSKLLLEEGIFELKNKFSLISFLANYAKWTEIEKLLEKDSVKRSLLNGDYYDFHTLQESKMDLSTLCKFFFEQANQEQLKNFDVNSLHQWILALSGDELIKYINEGKIKLEYPRYCYFIEDLYKAYPAHFQTILDLMLASGHIISDIPRDNEIQKCFMKLFLKHDGQWLNLISHQKRDVYNHKADLLLLA